jgi:predicted TIM-barrel fold metal-dependent hydrolase
MLLLFVSVTSCSTASRRAGTPTTATDELRRVVRGGIIDAHLHTEFADASAREAFFAELNRAGVSGAVSHTGENGVLGYEDLRARGVVHCFGIGERFGPREQKLLESGLASGRYSCIKVYLGYIARYAYDPIYEPAYRAAEKHRVPVVFHTGDTLDRDGKVKFADPLTIDEVAVDHRKVNFVIAHCGNPWIESAAEVAYKNPNVYLDGSALLIGDLSKLPREQVDEYLVRPVRWIFGYVEDPSKLLFGTDWPLSPIESYLEAFQRAIPRNHWQAVFHDNAVRVFPALSVR